MNQTLSEPGGVSSGVGAGGSKTDVSQLLGFSNASGVAEEAGCQLTPASKGFESRKMNTHSTDAKLLRQDIGFPFGRIKIAGQVDNTMSD